MNYDTYRYVSVCNTAGDRIVDRNAATFRYEPIENGFACYVTAKCGEGFSAEEAVCFSVDRADTADYLSINNHSAFWCRPFWASPCPSCRSAHRSF